MRIIVDNKCYYKQIKTSRIKLLNWLYGKIYGYEKKYYLADGETYVIGNDIYMNPNTFKNLTVG